MSRSLAHAGRQLLLKTELLTPLHALAWSAPEATDHTTAWDLSHWLCIIPKAEKPLEVEDWFLLQLQAGLCLS